MTSKQTSDKVEIKQSGDAEKNTGKKKRSRMTLYLIIGLVLLYVVAMIAAIYFQNRSTGPVTFEQYAQLSESYAAEIVTAHNDLFSVDPQRDLPSSSGKVSGIVRTVAASELDKRIKIMRTNAKKLAELKVIQGDEPPTEIAAFAEFISAEWIPFWEAVSGDIGEIKTIDDAVTLFDDLNDKVQNDEVGTDMREAFRGLARAGEKMGWDEKSYRARIK
jgi:hypothetical protein